MHLKRLETREVHFLFMQIVYILICFRERNVVLFVCFLHDRYAAADLRRSDFLRFSVADGFEQCIVEFFDRGRGRGCAGTAVGRSFGSPFLSDKLKFFRTVSSAFKRNNIEFALRIFAPINIFPLKF